MNKVAKDFLRPLEADQSNGNDRLSQQRVTVIFMIKEKVPCVQPENCRGVPHEHLGRAGGGYKYIGGVSLPDQRESLRAAGVIDVRER
jgi:hypothetical protein